MPISIFRFREIFRVQKCAMSRKDGPHRLLRLAIYSGTPARALSSQIGGQIGNPVRLHDLSLFVTQVLEGNRKTHPVVPESLLPGIFLALVVGVNDLPFVALVPHEVRNPPVQVHDLDFLDLLFGAERWSAPQGQLPMIHHIRTKRRNMTTDAKTLEKAEKVIDSLALLADAIEEGMIFHFQHDQSLGTVAGLGTQDDFNSRIGIRAALTRSEVANVVAMLEREDGKGNLGSLGFIFGRMKDPELQNLLTRDRGTGYVPDRAKFDEAQRLYKELSKSDELDRVRSRRHHRVGHILREGRTDMVFNEELFQLQEKVERIVTLLFQAFGLPTPRYVERPTSC